MLVSTSLPPCPNEFSLGSESRVRLHFPPCFVCLRSVGTNGDPQSLECGHSGCRECVRELIRNHPHDRRAAVCGLCRRETAEADVRTIYDLRDIRSRCGRPLRQHLHQPTRHTRHHLLSLRVANNKHPSRLASGRRRTTMP
ncbi:unnamed protein product [Vitrella brassicaformis CCMP3155]|uniref:RING-type domain-containing protein n=1 Tax=Vitrella brassicaformis (strain CCMP3155) TaxID=1169540 RepID=A0A0G4H587_VITBC|nr:unnamed protein product [Vitrella brassicaformis CCMP3155]|eukprot:CEM38781.1 unnamed protein product [Vitrella brassicaformis CCMP3155]